MAHPIRATRDDAGNAIMITIMMMAMLTTLTLTLATITITNLSSARSSQQAGAAVNAADAGVAQAISYVRNNGVSQLNECSPTCASLPWGNKDNPASVTINGKAGQTYKVWIEPLAPYPDNKPGIYRVHSSGVAGGPAARSITVDLSISSYEVPFGIMSNSVVGGGDAGVHHVSIFSTGCVYKRSKIVFEGIDAAYGIPAAVHTSQIITDSQGSGQYCPDTNKPIHKTNTGADKPCADAPYRYDQDKFGGPLDGTDCYDLAKNEFPGMTVETDPTKVAYKYPTTSLISSDEELEQLYGISQPPFTQAELDQLRTLAISQGNYWTTSKAAAQPSSGGSGWTVPHIPHAVVYFDLLGTADEGGTVDFNYFDDGTGYWSRDPGLEADDPNCEDKSLTIIIEGGNARLNSNSVLYASAFLISGDPYGKVFKANGTATFVGTLYANQLDLTGTSDMHLDQCFLNNTSPGLLTVERFNYRELDR